MGCNDIFLFDHVEDEIPLHSVTLSPFYMKKTEVTQAEYHEVMGGESKCN